MTTTVSLAARDFIVVGADSLATTSMDLVDPRDFAKYFDADGEVAIDPATNKPLLKYSQMFVLAQQRPVNQLPSVTKLFSLEPKRAAVLFAGIARIGDVSVKNLIEQFIASEDFKGYEAYTIEGLAERLRDFIVTIYDAEIPQGQPRPMMEVLLSGYSSGKRQPEIYRIVCRWDWIKNVFTADVTPEVKCGQYNVAYGGQYDVIQRVVHGIDVNSFSNLQAQAHKILSNYREKIQADLAAHGHPTAILEPDFNDKDLDIFEQRLAGVSGMGADVSDLSEKAGIEFVEFLINTMIKSQEFSSSIPTVGGEIHLGVLTKSSGFRWVRKPYLERARDSAHSQS